MSDRANWMSGYGTPVVLSVAMLMACGGTAVVDGGGETATVTTTGSTTSSTTSSGTTTTATTVPVCGIFDGFCDCWATQGCSPVGVGCLCHCDYECPGAPACDCDCGGGDYIGCASAGCPELEFPPGSTVAFEEDGCPYLVQ
jgi:hypothetical protein